METLLYDWMAKEIMEAAFIAGFAASVGRPLVRSDNYEEHFAKFYEEYGDEFRKGLKATLTIKL